jgi:hypothetical protein
MLDTALVGAERELASAAETSRRLRAGQRQGSELRVQRVFEHARAQLERWAGALHLGYAAYEREG